MRRPRLTPVIVLLAVPLLLVGLPVGYVLSCGPLASRFRCVADWERAYAPVLYLTDHSQVLSDALQWYLVEWDAYDEADCVLLRSLLNAHRHPTT